MASEKIDKKLTDLWAVQSALIVGFFLMVFIMFLSWFGSAAWLIVVPIVILVPVAFFAFRASIRYAYK